MVLFGELWAWEMPEAAWTWMKDLGKTGAGRGAGGAGTEQEGSPVQGTCSLGSTWAVCTGLRAGNWKTLFGFQVFHAVELFWTSVSSSVKWR